MKKALFTLLLFCLGFFISACGGGGGSSASGNTYIPVVTNTEVPNNNPDNPQQNLKTITLSQDTFTIDIGKTDNIIVYVDGEDKTEEATFTFVKENAKKSTVATVEKGLITALKQGTAIFKVSYQGANDVYFTVISNDPTIPTIELSKTEITVELGDLENETEAITVTLNGKDVTSEATFTSSDESVATVDNNGNITFVGEGKANIVAHVDGANDQIVKVTVNISEIQLEEETTTITVGNTYNIIAKINGKDVTSKATFTTNASKIATVGENNGTVTGIADGTATITIKVFGAKDKEFKANVYDPYLHTIVTNFEEVTMYVGGKTKNIAVTVGGQTPEIATYSSSDESIVTVDESGTITAVSEGIATVTVHVENTQEDKIITVTAKLYNITSDSNIALGFLETKKLALTNDDEEPITNATYECTPNDGSIINVDENGKITAGTTVGTATITVTAENTKEPKTITVTVSDDSSEVAIDDNVLNQLHAIRQIAYPSRYKSSLSEIDIPIYYRYNDQTYKITAIGDYAFQGCTSLTEITIPDNITSIGNYAFDECTSLSNIEITENITDIGNWAFNNCESLPSINIPTNVTKIKAGTFNGCTSLECTIPATITDIESFAFGYANKITLPNNVSNIEDGAFLMVNNLCNYNCDTYDTAWGAYGITISENVTKIKEKCFYDENSNYNYNGEHCDNKYGYGYYNYELHNITIPATVTEFGKDAFRSCEYLETVTINGNNLTNIGNRSFRYCQNLTTINIPNSVTKIGNEAFRGCENLQTFTMPDSVTELGNSAFINCHSLQTITLSNNITSIGDYTFEETQSLDSITIPYGVTRIGSRAFQYSGISNINIPNSVSSIGDRAFRGCSNLESINLPSAINTIETATFHQCSRLSIDLSGISSVSDVAFSGCGSVSNIPSSYSTSSFKDTTIYGTVNLCDRNDSDAFENSYIENLIINNNTNISSYNIQVNNLTITGEGDFHNKGCFHNHYYDNYDNEYDDYYIYSANNVYIENGITSISANTFESCSFENLTIPDNISIWPSALLGCGLTTVNTHSGNAITIPDDISTIGNVTFIYAATDDVTTIEIPNTMTKIPNYACYSLDSLQTVTLPDSITSIGECAFSSCTGLTSINIPSSVTSIEDGAFSGCTALTNITLPDNITTIGSAFSGSGLTSIIIPNSITGIGSYAFIGCTDLTSVTLPNTLTSIDQNAFNNCTSLTEINIPDSVTTIGGQAFYNAGKDTSDGLTLTIPNSVTSIGDNAFGSRWSSNSYKVKFYYSGSATGSPWGGTQLTN